MGRVTLTIHIDYDQADSAVSVEQSKTIGPGETPMDRPAQHWTEPLDEAPWPETPASAPTMPVAAMQANGTCPVHGLPWKTVPAGVSKKTGAAYLSFLACPTQGCNERPRK